MSSLLLLYILLDSWNTDGFLQKLGMTGVQYGQITTAVYLKVSISDFLTLFSARTGRHYFWQVKPAPILLAGGAVALTLSSFFSIFWPNSQPDDILVEGLQSDLDLFGFVWAYCILFWFLQDVCKVLVYKWMDHVNFNDITRMGVAALPASAVTLIKELEEALANEPK
jgi:H+-transporting ATPase